MRFLIDTCAEVSVVPANSNDLTKTLNTNTLEAANGTPIHTCGERSATLDLGLRRTFRWRFIIAKVRHAVIGADFLAHFHLLVDMSKNCLMDCETHLTVHGVSTQPAIISPTLLRPKPKSSFENILYTFPSLTQPCNAQRPIKHDVLHYISTTGPLSTHDLADYLQRSVP